MRQHRRRLHVAVGVIRDHEGRVLIAKRPDDKHQGGLWEFPGGKVDAGETVEQALHRELHEELAIDVQCIRPLITIPHHYPDCEVLLDVWTVSAFSGQPHGREGQPIQWVAPEQLDCFQFPAANRPIISAILLPNFYAIVQGETAESVLDRLRQVLNAGLKLVQLRLKQPISGMAEMLARASELCRRHQAVLLLNSALKDQGCRGLVDGLHLTSADLLSSADRPPGCRWLAASCHDAEELRRAVDLGVDFVVLAPVQPTQTHPDATPLGWDTFAELVAESPLPVFALGGLQRQDLQRAIDAGAQGIAGIRCFIDE